ncbi:hypothetical protein M0R72_10895 [Candidatus Pacearchaeota archaeon]|jgi:chromosome segregation ATPase|nr:hypothetical protein [Candidatus Pacearchaeota archaeon]
MNGTEGQLFFWILNALWLVVVIFAGNLLRGINGKLKEQGLFLVKLQDKIIDISKDVACLETTMRERTDDIRHMQTEIISLRQEVAAIRAEHDKAIAAIQSKQDSVEKRLERIESKIDDLHATVKHNGHNG